MLYECIHHNFGIGNEDGRIVMFEFAGETIDTVDGKIRLGEYDTCKEHNQAVVKLKDKELQQRIEATDEYKLRTVGRAGLWRKSDRLSAIERETMTMRLADSMKVLDEDMLRHFIARNGQKVGMDAPKEVLVALATKIALQKQGIEAAETAEAPAPTPPVKAKKAKAEVLTT